MESAPPHSLAPDSSPSLPTDPPWDPSRSPLSLSPRLHSDSCELALGLVVGTLHPTSLPTPSLFLFCSASRLRAMAVLGTEGRGSFSCPKTKAEGSPKVTTSSCAFPSSEISDASDSSITKPELFAQGLKSGALDND